MGTFITRLKELKAICVICNLTPNSQYYVLGSLMDLLDTDVARLLQMGHVHTQSQPEFKKR